MPGKKTQLNKFADLAWNDLEEWAGSRIVSRGKNYQGQGRVCDLAIIEDNRPVPKISRDDARLKLLEDEDWNDEPVDEETAVSEEVQEEINRKSRSSTLQLPKRLRTGSS